MREKLLIFLTLAIILLTGCGGRRTPFVSGRLDTLYKPRYATGFSILRGGERSSVLSIVDPWQGAVGVNQSLFLARGGEAPPVGFDGVVVEAPLRRVVCMSSSYVGFIDALGETDAIVGVSGTRFVHNEKVRTTAREVGYDTQMNYELIATLKPDLVFIYGVAGENVQATGKLRELGIPYIYIGEYVEQSPLGRAEWLVAFGAMFNRRTEAEAAFNRVRENYLGTMRTVAKAVDHPLVMLNAPYRDAWYLPTRGSYMARLIADAGGEYNGDDGGGETYTVSAEAAYLMSASADVWLNPGQATTMAELAADNPRFVKIPVVKNGQVYNNNARTTRCGGSDFWESGVVRPDIVLKDVAKILHPGLFPRHDLYYFQQLQ